MTQIETALKCDAPLPALALALALPDICTTLEFADRRKTTNAESYSAWCDAYIPVEAALANEHLYSLRCAFLHNGSSVMTERHRKRGTLEKYILTCEPRFSVAHVSKLDVDGELQEFVAMSVYSVCHGILWGVRNWRWEKAQDVTVQTNLETLVVLQP